MRLIVTSSLILLIAFANVPPVCGAIKSTNNPQFDAAVARALRWLQTAVAASEPHGGEHVLATYAMMKCGVPATDPLVLSGIQAAVDRSSRTTYQPVSPYDHIYGAGVDAMFLADIDADLYKPNLQVIANYIQSVQRSDGSWSDTPTNPGDVSMSQYGVLGLWAAQRAGCNVSPQVFDRAADFHLRKGNQDGGWGYRPGTNAGPGQGSSTHNMTMAGAGTLSVARFVLHGPKFETDKPKEQEADLFGVMKKVDPMADSKKIGSAFPDYKAANGAGTLDGRVERAFSWNMANLTAVSKVEHNMYFYYCIERAAALNELGNINGTDWYTFYGNGLLTLQSEDGSFKTHSGPVSGTSLALLFYMRSTGQILEKLVGGGLLRGDRGNPLGKKEKEKDPTALDHLLASIEKMDTESLKVDESEFDLADEIVRSVTSIQDPEELVGQVDRLKKLVNHPKAEVRQPVIWALGRTGDFSLVPFILKGLRDPNVDVNVEAEFALRYIARKPSGFGLSSNPIAGAENASDSERLRVANIWRDKAYKAWSNWYFERRPFEDRDGFDELEAQIPVNPRNP
ncbi:MAG: hypothetical protein R3C20_11165 [Planctomycetaceae bacterium]